MNTKQKPLVELTEEALTILQRKLGTADTIRFIRQFSTGFGDYTAERSEHPEESLDELVNEIKTRRQKNGVASTSGVDNPTSYQHRIDKIRQQYPRAYEKWTEEEDGLLRQSYRDGSGLKELTIVLQRQPGAIESRLRKLGLMS